MGPKIFPALNEKSVNGRAPDSLKFALFSPDMFAGGAASGDDSGGGVSPNGAPKQRGRDQPASVRLLLNHKPTTPQRTQLVIHYNPTHST
jgi:hypothetical protein